MKDDACHQMEAHHYCKQVRICYLIFIFRLKYFCFKVNEDFAQCVLFDS